MGTSFVMVEEETGEVPIAAPLLDEVVAYIGTSASGTALDPKRIGKAAALRSIYGEGPGTTAMAHVLKKTKRPAVFCRIPSTVDAEYGTIDVTGVTGTAVVTVDATSLPLNNYEGYLRVADPGTVATAGITLLYSIDNGRTLSGKVKLGTALTYTIPGTAIKFDFAPPAAPLVTLVTEILADMQAHFALTAGSVHGAADAGPYTLGAAPTTKAEAITRLGQILTALSAHVVKIASSVHGAADSTANTALGLLSAPTTEHEAVDVANSIKAILNAHESRTAGGVHGADDSSNQISAADASHGTLNAGDVIKVKTKGPRGSSDDITDAFLALAETGLDFSMVYVAQSMSATEAEVVSAGLDTLLGVGKRVTAILFARAQGDGVPGETEVQWIDALALDYATYFDDRVAVCAGTAWVTIDDGEKVRRYDTTWAPALMARLVVIDRFVSPALVDDGPLDGVSLVDESNKRIGHDEAWIGGLDEARFTTVHRLDDPNRRAGVYINHPLVMKPADGRISQIQVRRVTNAAARVAASESFGTIGSALIYDPTSGLIDENAQIAIRNKIREPLTREFARDIANPNAEDLVDVDRAVTVSGDSVYVDVIVNMVPFKYIDGITLRFSLKV